MGNTLLSLPKVAVSCFMQKLSLRSAVLGILKTNSLCSHVLINPYNVGQVSVHYGLWLITHT